MSASDARSAGDKAPPLVTLDKSDRLAWIRLDSPHNRNAISAALITELRAALDEATEDDGIRAVVLGHTGGTFCAGADLKAATAVSVGDPVRARGEQITDLLRAIVALPKPVIGAIDGHVRAGGMGLVCVCDIALAGPKSTFAVNEALLGVAASVISPFLLPRLTDRVASRLLLTGETFDADAAARHGVVTEAVPDIDVAVRAYADRLVGVSPQGLAESKGLLTHHLLARIDGDRERVIDQSTRLFASPEAREGMLAFFEKRPPYWAG